MSREFDYALRKDVRNNPIVREVDQIGRASCRERVYVLV